MGKGRARTRLLAAAGATAAVAGATLYYFCWPVPRAAGPMPHDVYVWQRAWTDPVIDAVTAEGPRFGEVCALAGEISFRGGKPHAAYVNPDFAALRAAGRPVGIAVRIGPLPAGAAPAAFEPASPVTLLLLDTVLRATSAARAGGVTPREVQIDFDCAESNLDGYRKWVADVRRCAPVCITVLPSWLKRWSFGSLAREAGSFVLQVHSLHKPDDPDGPATICDAAEARAYVERAARVGVPFRVALPTYGYVASYDASGKLLGLAAEGPAGQYPTATRRRTLTADPESMAELVRGWATDRPRAMTGVIWYRLPIADDTLNWRFATLRSVMAGVAPHADLRVELSRPKPRLIEVALRNAGDADAALAVDVALEWDGAAAVADDGTGGFDAIDSGPAAVTLHASPEAAAERLTPGESRAVGWVRLDADKEVRARVTSISTAVSTPRR